MGQSEISSQRSEARACFLQAPIRPGTSRLRLRRAPRVRVKIPAERRVHVHVELEPYAGAHKQVLSRVEAQGAIVAQVLGDDFRDNRQHTAEEDVVRVVLKEQPLAMVEPVQDRLQVAGEIAVASAGWVVEGVTVAALAGGIEWGQAGVGLGQAGGLDGVVVE